MTKHQDPSSFRVDRHPPETDAEHRIVNTTHPWLKELAIAGLSAYFIATGRRLTGLPFIAGAPTILASTDVFLAALAHQEDADRRLAVRGAHVLELARHATAFFKAHGHNMARPVIAPVVQELPHIRVRGIWHQINRVRAVVRAQPPTEPDQYMLQLSVHPGHNTQEGTWLALRTQGFSDGNTVRVSLASGPVANGFPDTVQGDQFGSVESFALALQAAEAD